MSFEKILSNTKVEDIKPNPPIPPGTYMAMTLGNGEWGESAVKRSKQLSWKCKLLQAKDDVDEQKLQEWKDETGETVVGQEFYPRFYNDVGAALFLLALGLESRSAGEAIAESGGRQFLVKIIHKPSQDGKRMIHEFSEFLAL